MKIIDFDNTPQTDWDNVSANSPEAWFFHSYDWGKIEAEFFTEKPLSFSIYDDRNKCIGICPLYYRKSARGWTENVLDSGYHRHAGPAFLDDIPAGDRKAAIKICMSRIFDSALAVNADRIILNSHNMAPANTDRRIADIPFWMKDYQFIQGLGMNENGDMSFPGYSTLSADQIVVLDKSEDELFSDLDDDFRKAVRKAIKNGAVVKGNVQSPVAEYYQIAAESAKRTGETLNPIDYYEKLWNAFAPSGKAKILFIEVQERLTAAILLIIDKGAANFFGGVSLPDSLNLRVNNFMHWEAVLWAKRNGLKYYRLGPIFPELPRSWPVSKVSKFKGDMGGISLPIIQGCKFLNPEKYLDNAAASVKMLCSRTFNSSPFEGNSKILADCREVLRSFGVASDEINTHLKFFPYNNPPIAEYELAGKKKNIPMIKTAGGFFRKSRTMAYKTILDSVAFRENSGSCFGPDNAGAYAGLINEDGPSGKSLYCGVNLLEETIAYRQGDPGKVKSNTLKSGLGFDFERPMYLFEDNVDKENPTIPWADRLGFTIAEKLSGITGIPLVEPLPHGLKGLFIITGDDDQAELDKYDEQIKTLDGLPITYFLHYKTRHTAETISKMPLTAEFAFHPDALDAPADYDKLFSEQQTIVKALLESAGRCMKPMIRNHGFLNDGYLGHLKTWEKYGIELSSNLPGIDGTALNGSFLPMKLRRADRTWSNHYSILTAFGDGIVFALKQTEQQANDRILQIVRQIESENPGVLVFNLHPQNIKETRKIHEELVMLSKRDGWNAMKLGDYFEWIKMRDTITLSVVGRKLQLKSHLAGIIENLVLKFPAKDGSWIRVPVPAWTIKTEVDFPE